MDAAIFDLLYSDSSPLNCDEGIDYDAYELANEYNKDEFMDWDDDDLEDDDDDDDDRGFGVI